MSVVVGGGGGGGKGQLRGDRLGEVRPCSRSEISSKILCCARGPTQRADEERGSLLVTYRIQPSVRFLSQTLHSIF